ncbi:hypothetical protein M408DRAFT_331580 [Serendipita vermifera MAFF 305830]|uniref:Uncharacterized protein n=1 Tax=Serendipita vermifera MAFF 305830 TaxID=933852 RepID=A0A0C3AK04_SERVB|nr:hypothetical protein M408DRAFT_331580 [Serendipita vermifera MAFF 305830]
METVGIIIIIIITSLARRWRWWDHGHALWRRAGPIKSPLIVDGHLIPASEHRSLVIYKTTPIITVVSEPSCTTGSNPDGEP